MIAGIILVIIGLSPFIAPIYAALVGILMYFGIKVYVGRRRKMVEQDIGEGICVECGFKVIDNKCPNCDMEDKSFKEE